MQTAPHSASWCPCAAYGYGTRIAGFPSARSSAQRRRARTRRQQIGNGVRVGHVVEIRPRVRQGEADALVLVFTGQRKQLPSGSEASCEIKATSAWVNKMRALASRPLRRAFRTETVSSPRRTIASSRRGKARKAARIGTPVVDQPQTSSTIGASSLFVKPGSALGSSRTTGAAESRKSRRMRAARATGKADVTAGRDHEIRALRCEQPKTL